MITFEKFKEYLNELHRRSGDEIMMYDNATDLGDGFFSYEYDGLVRQVLKFLDNGTVWEWHDCAYRNYHIKNAFDQVHFSVEEWMVTQMKRVAIPE